jgi:hypothetical protein
VRKRVIVHSAPAKPPTVTTTKRTAATADTPSASATTAPIPSATRPVARTSGVAVRMTIATAATKPVVANDRAGARACHAASGGAQRRERQSGGGGFRATDRNGALLVE